MITQFVAIAFVMLFCALVVVTCPIPSSIRLGSSGFAKLPLLFVLAAVGLGAAIYFMVGRPDPINNTSYQEQPLADAAEWARNAAPQVQRQAGSVADLIGGLEQRLAENPDNGKDWLLLAKSYDHLHRREDAVAAYQKASALGFRDEALEAQLKNVHTNASPVSIEGRVTLSADAKERVAPTDTVFVLAKEAGGPPMPLAVIKRSAGELPFEFNLGDRETMVAGRSISSVVNVIVEAKISETGDALSTRPGLSVTSDVIGLDEEPYLTLVIGAGNAAVADDE